MTTTTETKTITADITLEQLVWSAGNWMANGYWLYTSSDVHRQDAQQSEDDGCRAWVEICLKVAERCAKQARTRGYLAEAIQQKPYAEDLTDYDEFNDAAYFEWSEMAENLFSPREDWRPTATIHLSRSDVDLVVNVRDES